MVTLAFKDGNDGYYEYDSPDGTVPSWAEGLTPCDVQTPTVNAWPAHQAAAQAALEDSDITILRCAEHGVTVPDEWKSYRAALRAIVAASTGDATAALPTKPAYPSGT